MISPKANNREKTERRLFGNRASVVPVLARLRIICGFRWRREGRFAVGRHEELIPHIAFTAGFPQYGWKAGFPSGAFPNCECSPGRVSVADHAPGSKRLTGNEDE